MIYLFWFKRLILIKQVISLNKLHVNSIFTGKLKAVKPASSINLMGDMPTEVIPRFIVQ